MQRLIWSPSALNDLREINDFLMERDGAAALRILRAIRGSVDLLTGFPRLGPALEEPFRMLKVRSTPYLIVYRVGREDVEIIRVRHARENWAENPAG